MLNNKLDKRAIKNMDFLNKDVPMLLSKNTTKVKTKARFGRKGFRWWKKISQKVLNKG